MPDGRGTRVLPGGRTGAFFFIAILCTPFLFGLTLHVFPIDVTNAALAVLGVLILSAIFGNDQECAPDRRSDDGPVLAMADRPVAVFNRLGIPGLLRCRDARHLFVQGRQGQSAGILESVEAVRQRSRENECNCVHQGIRQALPPRASILVFPVPGASTDFYKVGSSSTTADIAEMISRTSRATHPKSSRSATPRPSDRRSFPAAAHGLRSCRTSFESGRVARGRSR